MEERPAWTSESGFAEHRRHPRARRSLLLHHRCLELGLEKWAVSFLRDISQSGLRFTHPGGYMKGLLLEMRLALPIFKNPYPLNGVVAWTRRLREGIQEVGVRFVLDSDDDATPHNLARVVRYFQERPRNR